MLSAYGLGTSKKSPQKKQSYNVSQEKELRKRDLKRKFTDQRTVEAKIARTELSIEKTRETHFIRNMSEITAILGQAERNGGQPL